MPSLTIEGADIYYELVGKGHPAVVLIHGGMCDQRDWTTLREMLAKDCAVLTLDLRAHGRSGGDPDSCSGERWAKDVNALVAELNLAPAVFVGHSMGSRVAAEAIWQHPKNAAALVLLDGSRAYDECIPLPPPELNPVPPRSSVDYLNVTIGPYADDENRAQILATMSSASPELMAACLRAMADWDTNRSDQVFSELPPTLPVLAIQSTYHDRASPRRSLENESETTPYLDFLRQSVPRLESAILTRTGHFSMRERPDEVAALIRNFIRRAV